ncbi:MAG: Trp family transcriptional regulator [Candidatus Marinimicrobia bacterium]|nr:Trp family transcriptional regulator [Candidatus Neomarinimicrobiota bacterium]
MHTYDEIVKVFCRITEAEEMKQFLGEILTESEVEALVFRWRLMKDLYHGETQRHIAEKHHISLCKITRGSRILKNPNTVSLKMLNNMEKES